MIIYQKYMSKLLNNINKRCLEINNHLDLGTLSTYFSSQVYNIK